MMSPVRKALSIRPAEFYGSGLCRPRYFDNPQFNSTRVDPPLSVIDPLLSWAKDAHWSMGGLNFTRLRFQGRIEGKVSKLRAQLENSSPMKLESGYSEHKKRSEYESPPAAPIAMKRRRFLDLNEDGEESEDEGVTRIRRKLSDDFDRVAGESKMNLIKTTNKSIVPESGGKRLQKERKTDKVSETSPTRTSPRLTKRRSS